MKGKYSTINEEIIRIKSLFNDGRLYGNLVEQPEDYWGPMTRHDKKPEKSWFVGAELAKLYRLWANSSPELSKKYGKKSEYDLDAVIKDPRSGTFNKSYSQGKSPFDRVWLIVIGDHPRELIFTKGGEPKYKVLSKSVLPKKLDKTRWVPDPYSKYGHEIKKGSDVFYWSGNGVDWANIGKTPNDEKEDGAMVKEIMDIYGSRSTVFNTDKLSSVKGLKKARTTMDNLITSMKASGWRMKIFGGDNPRMSDVIKTSNVSAVLTIHELVTGGFGDSVMHAALTGIHGDCLTVKTKDIGTYSEENAKKYQTKIDNVTKLRGGRQEDLVPYAVYTDENGLPARQYKKIENNNPGNTFFLEPFYFQGKDWEEIWNDTHTVNLSNPFATKLFPDGATGFLSTWFGSTDVRKIKVSMRRGTAPFCSGGGLSFVPRYASAELSIHDVLQVAAAIAWFIPGGQGVALALELVDSGIYIYEGDPFGGIIGLTLVMVPLLGPMLRNVSRSGVKRLESFMIDTEKFLKGSPSKKEATEWITKEKQLRKLTGDEIKAFDEIIKNSKKIDSNLGKINAMSKSERVKFLKEKSKEFNKLWGKNVGWRKGSKYWERQLDLNMGERVLIPSVIIGLVVYGNMSIDDARVELNDAGFENITVKDIEVLISDEIFKDLIDRDPNEEIDVKKLSPEEKQKRNDLYNFVYIVNKVGTDSPIYKDIIVPNKDNMDKIFDVANQFKNDEELSKIEYRKLSDNVDYKWYKLLKCKADPYSKHNINVSGEDKVQGYIDEHGTPLELKGDDKYQYSEYDGLWFFKEKTKDGDIWKLLKNCLSCSRLQRNLNIEMDEFKSKFDFENELNFEINNINK
jgi:hypothetical protein